MFFHISIRFSWLVAFSVALGVFFLLFTSLTVCKAIHDCLYSTEFLILLILLWMYSSGSFWYVLVSSLCAFLSFYISISFFYYIRMLFSRHIVFALLLVSPMELYVCLSVWLVCILLLLSSGLKKLWNMTLIPIVIGVLGTVTRGFVQRRILLPRTPNL